MDTYFVMYQWNKTFSYYNYNTANKATFAFHKVVQRHYSGDVGAFIISDAKFPQDSVHQKFF